MHEAVDEHWNTLMLVIDETQADLAAMMLADFGVSRSGETPGRRLVDWLHYRARRVAERPRQVIRSNEVEAHRITFPDVDEITTRLVAGIDVSLWLGKSIRRNKEDPRADLMFNHWQVSHFHVEPRRGTPGKIGYGDQLLFAYIGADRAILLDVQPHRTWTRSDLLRILLRIDPSAMQDTGPAGEKPLTDADHKTIRGKHSNAMIEIDGRAYSPPGWGLMASGDSMRFRVLADYLGHLIGRTVHQIETNTLPPDQMQRLAEQIGLPVRLGLRFERGLLILYDKNRRLDLAAPKMVVA